ncbi:MULTISPECIES: hypothetical protein [unclassified Aquimarina]|uniref:hypothetical protein n=1 Tax=unclassified Aquimarina TaxID=2627091 RepID=UPI000D68B88C|nr:MULTISPECIES: hypothetical protein [unclassified Aquimarina]KAA1239806.1 hypothetical protein F0000_27255 [Aquimarina sp. RZ0]
MKLSCEKCSKREFEVPNFTSEEKKNLSELKANNKLGELIQKIESLYDIESIDAKFSFMHINKKYGKCNRCNVDYLEGEYVECPKCKALNFNWKTEK